MRIVHAVRSTAFAGVERYVASVTAALAGRGHDVVVIANEHSRMRDAINDANVRVEQASGTLGMARAVATRSRGADIVHAHMTAAEVSAVLAQSFSRPALVFTRHFPDRRGSSLPARIVAPFIGRTARVELAISTFVADSIDEPTEVLRNGVADRAAIDPAQRVVLVAQRLEAEKHTEDALAAWENSGLAAEGWGLWIAGDGRARASLEATTTSSSSAVRFLGQRRDLDALRADAGIFLATAPAEPFGLSVAEAMAAALPVVAAGAGGHLETVGVARPDLLYPPGDISACAQLLRRLAGDIELRRAAGRDLQAFQRHELGLEQHVDRLCQVYERVRKKASP